MHERADDMVLFMGLCSYLNLCEFDPTLVFPLRSKRDFQPKPLKFCLCKGRIDGQCLEGTQLCRHFQYSLPQMITMFMCGVLFIGPVLRSLGDFLNNNFLMGFPQSVLHLADIVMWHFDVHVNFFLITKLPCSRT